MSKTTKKKRPSGGAALKASGKTAIQFGIPSDRLAELDAQAQARLWSRARWVEQTILAALDAAKG